MGRAFPTACPRSPRRKNKLPRCLLRYKHKPVRGHPTALCPQTAGTNISQLSENQQLTIVDENLNQDLEGLRDYVENYVKPMAESVEKLVTTIEKLEMALARHEEQIKYISGRISEQDADMAHVFRLMSTLPR